MREKTTFIMGFLVGALFLSLGGNYVLLTQVNAEQLMLVDYQGELVGDIIANEASCGPRGNEDMVMYCTATVDVEHIEFAAALASDVLGSQESDRLMVRLVKQIKDRLARHGLVLLSLSGKPGELTISAMRKT